MRIPNTLSMNKSYNDVGRIKEFNVCIKISWFAKYMDMKGLSHWPLMQQIICTQGVQPKNRSLQYTKVEENLFATKNTGTNR